VLVLVALAALLVVGAERVGLLARFTRSFTFSDPSAVGHLASFEASIPFILEHPLGIGIGMAGPRALRFADEAKIEHVESSYFQMMIEIGVPGTLFTLGVLLLMVWTLRRQRAGLDTLRYSTSGGTRFPPIACPEPVEGLGGQGGLFEGINLAAQVAWLGAMAAFAFLPLMQELQLMSWLWVVAGIPLVVRR
jgi:O-antigen ligase